MRIRFAGRDFEPYDVGLFVVGLLLAAMSVLPVLFIVLTAFKPTTEVFGSGAMTWIPQNPTVDEYAQAFDAISDNLKNSVFIATGTAILTLLVTIPGAYVFGRKRFYGKRFTFYVILLAFMFPHLLLIVPISDLWRDLGLYNTIPGLWIAYQILVAPWAIWVLRDYFAKLPDNLEEAAEVYGCTELSAIYRVILPLSLPVIVAVGFLSFLIAWNDFLYANLLTTGDGPRPAVVQLFIMVFQVESFDWSQMMANTVIVAAPPTVLYLYARRYLSEAFATR